MTRYRCWTRKRMNSEFEIQCVMRPKRLQTRNCIRQKLHVPRRGESRQTRLQVMHVEKHKHDSLSLFTMRRHRKSRSAAFALFQYAHVNQIITASSHFLSWAMRRFCLYTVYSEYRKSIGRSQERWRRWKGSFLECVATIMARIEYDWNCELYYSPFRPNGGWGVKVVDQCFASLASMHCEIPLLHSTYRCRMASHCPHRSTIGVG